MFGDEVRLASFTAASRGSQSSHRPIRSDQRTDTFVATPNEFERFFRGSQGSLRMPKSSRMISYGRQRLQSFFCGCRLGSQEAAPQSGAKVPGCRRNLDPGRIRPRGLYYIWLAGFALIRMEIHSAVTVVGGLKSSLRMYLIIRSSR